MVTFRTYLLTRRITDNARGDFLKGTRDYRDFPDDLSDEGALRRYLMRKNACREAIDEGIKLWRQYCRRKTQSVDPT